MAKRDLPSIEVLRQLLRYEQESGKLFWLPRPVEMFADGRQTAEHNSRIWNGRYAGKEALCTPKPAGHLYGTISTNGVKLKIYAHRAAWAIVHGEWPVVIDHINGDPADNRLSNLRSVTQAINARNQKRRSTNTSGYTGVHFFKPKNRWAAQIVTHGVSRTLGYFKTREEAAAVRRAAAEAAGFTPRHG